MAKVESLQGWRRYLAVIGSLTLLLTMLGLGVQASSLSGPLAGAVPEGCPADPASSVLTSLKTGDIEVKTDYENGGNGEETIKDPALDGGVSRRFTGETFSQTIGISNTAADPNKTYRVYFQFQNTESQGTSATKADGPKMGYVLAGAASAKLEVGTTYYQTAPNTNPYTFNKVPNSENFYYIEVAGSNIGDAFSLPVKVKYDSPASPGGAVSIWAEEIDQPSGTAPAPSADTAPSCGIHSATWDTERHELEAHKELRDASKAANTWKREIEAWGAPVDPSVAFNPKSGRFYIRGLRYQVEDATLTAGSSKVGQDPISGKLVYTDTLTLPENIEINPEVLPQLQNAGYWQQKIGDYDKREGWNATGGNNTHFFYKTVTVNGVERPVFGVDASNGFDGNAWNTHTFKVSPDGRKISFSYTPVTAGTYLAIKFADDFFLVKEPQGWDRATQGPYVPPEDVTFNFTNSFDLKVNYSHTPAVTLNKTIETPVKPDGAKPSVTKTHDQPNATYRSGDPVEFTINVKNEGTSPWKVNEGRADQGKIIDALPRGYYVSPLQMAQMLNSEPAPSIKVTDAKWCTATIAQHTSTSGKGTTPDSQLECTQAEPANLTITKTSAGKFAVMREGGNTQDVVGTPEALNAALKQLVVGENTLYTLTWEIPTVNGGQEYKLAVRATVKDQSMTKADPDEAATTNTVNIEGKDVPDKVTVEKDFSFNKAAYINNTKVEQSGHVITAGTIVDYQLTVERRGGKADYNALPMVDALSGSQVLLVPATNANSHLAGTNGITTITRDGSTYYVLDKPGTYTGVVFSAREKNAAGVVTEKTFVADRIEVTQLADKKGLQTNTYWYMNSQDFASPSTVTVSYRTLTAPERTGFEPTVPGNPGAINIGGIMPPDTRVTDKTEMDLSALSSEKRIVTKRGETPDQDETASASALAPGTSVTYRLGLSRLGTEPFQLTGKDIYDALPKRLVEEPWTKDLVSIEIPQHNGLTVESGDLNAWQITNANPANGEVDPTQQFIVWPEDVKISLTKTAYMYVTVKFPAGEQWNAYRSAYGNQSLFNTWHVKDAQSQVSHYLAGESRAELQKGTVATGRITPNGVSTEWHDADGSSGSASVSGPVLVPDTGLNGRVFYQNSTIGTATKQVKYAQYYGVIHNDGESRLYLNDVQDKLPEGFIFGSGIGDEGLRVSQEGCEIRSRDSSHPCSSDVIVFDNEGALGFGWRPPKTTQPVVKLKVLPGGKTQPPERPWFSGDFIQYTNWQTTPGSVPVTLTNTESSVKRASVHATINPVDPTHITFSFDNSLEGSDLNYDESRGKYYLNSGETIAFEYYAIAGEKSLTQPTAHNGLAMPFDDFAGTGVKTNPDVSITSKPFANNPLNDGDRSIIDTATANSSGFVGGDDNTQWLTSGVDHVRGSVVPGVTKSVVAKTGPDGQRTANPAYAGYADTLEWAITAHNDSDQVIEDYVISDVLDEGYVFTGAVVLEKSQNEFSTEYSSDALATSPITFKEWTYAADGTPQSAQITAKTPAWGRVERIEVNGEPLALRSGNAIAHVWLDTVEQQVNDGDGNPRTATKLRLNVRVIESSQTLNAPGRSYANKGYPLAPGEFMRMSVSSTNPKKAGSYHVVYNSGYVTLPVDTFDPADVKRGSPTTHDMKYAQPTESNKNYPSQPDTTKAGNYCYSTTTGRLCKWASVPDVPAIQADASIPIAQDAYTSSVESVEEKDNPENKVTSGQSPDFITLPKQSSLFTYTMEVENNRDDALQKMTIINNLPQPEDKYTFGVGPDRLSDFKVDFASSPNLVVEAQTETGEWTLIDPSRYKAEFSDKTSFDATDWAGASSDAWGLQKPSSRALRISFDTRDGSEQLMPGKTKLRVRFDAKIAAGENPARGAIGYNTFGYSYVAPGTQDMVLQAIPKKVGVQVPNSITLRKSVVDAEGQPATAAVDTSYRFVVYSGDPITDADLADGKTIGDVLTAQNRNFAVVTVPIAKGTSESEPIEIAPQHKYSYANGQWVESGEPWVWSAGGKYHIAEIDDGAGATLTKFVDTTGQTPVETTGQQEFVYDATRSMHFMAVNRLDRWQLTLRKVDGDTCAENAECTDPLPGAIFGLYSPEKSEAMGTDDFQALQTQVGANVPSTTVKNGTTYFLTRSAISDDNGLVEFANLAGDEYFVSELKAPEGYNLSWDGRVVTKPGAGQVSEQMLVKNYKPYEIPQTGGSGTLMYTVAGMILVVGTAAAMAMRQRRRYLEE